MSIAKDLVFLLFAFLDETTQEKMNFTVDLYNSWNINANIQSLSRSVSQREMLLISGYARLNGTSHVPEPIKMYCLLYASVGALLEWFRCAPPWTGMRIFSGALSAQRYTAGRRQGRSNGVFGSVVVNTLHYGEKHVWEFLLIKRRGFRIDHCFGLVTEQDAAEHEIFVPRYGLSVQGYKGVGPRFHKHTHQRKHQSISFSGNWLERIGKQISVQMELICKGDGSVLSFFWNKSLVYRLGGHYPIEHIKPRKYVMAVFIKYHHIGTCVVRLQHYTCGHEEEDKINRYCLCCML